MKKVLLLSLVCCFAFATTEVNPGEQSGVNKLTDIKQISGVCYKKLENPSHLVDLSLLAFLGTIALNTEAEVNTVFKAIKAEAGQDCEQYKNLAQAFVTKMNAQLESLTRLAKTCPKEAKKLQDKIETLLRSEEVDLDPAVVLSPLKQIDFSKDNVCEQVAAIVK